MKRWLEVLFGIIALAAGIYGALWVRGQFAPAQDMVTIPVPRQQIPAYTLITQDQLALREVPANVAQLTGFAVTAEDITGKVALGALAQGMPIPRALLTTPQDFSLAPPDQELFVLSVDPSLIVGGQVEPGQRVRVYDIVTDKNSGQATANFIAELPVLALLDSNGKPVQPSVPASSSAQTASKPALLVTADRPGEVQRILAAVSLAQSHSGLRMTLAPLTGGEVQAMVPAVPFAPTPTAGSAQPTVMPTFTPAPTE